MDPWMTWRLVKLVAILLFAGGVFGAALAPPGRSRALAGGALAPFGAVLTWAAGWQMMKFTGREITEPWILLSFGASLVAVGGAAALAGTQRQPWLAALAVGALVASTGWMVVRPVDPAALAGVGLASLALGGLIWPLHPHEGGAPSPDFAERLFVGVARAEGASLILLLASTASKAGFQAPFDGGTGVIGWVHGVLVIMFLPALVAAGLALRWSLAWTGLGFVASLLPFGTFLFEVATRRSTLAGATPKA